MRLYCPEDAISKEVKFGTVGYLAMRPSFLRCDDLPNLVNSIHLLIKSLMGDQWRAVKNWSTTPRILMNFMFTSLGRF
jgi:hypothetical protein